MEDRVAIITGGHGGIGLATGLLFAQTGYRVILADQVRACSASPPPNVIEFVCDLRSSASVHQLFEFCRNELGKLNVLVTAHGAHNSVKCADATVEEFDFVMDTNFKAVFFCCKEALQLMQEGVIINVGSSVGIAADKDAPIYSASKAAVHQLTKCLAQEYGRRVRVNAVAPGPIDTPLLRRAFNNSDEDIEAYRKIAVRGIARAEEVAQVILFMASDACQFMNGAVVPFDGGESIMYFGEPPKSAKPR
jgi:NAD(P)-dependent dehydrogenase (short-subunit alcohol dehydrogenase family)